MNYSPEFKEAMLRRMLPPNNESIKKIAKEEGLSEQTLRNWRDKARKEGYAKEAARLNRELKDSQKERKMLEKELQRKEKALAEAAALLVLSKKANAIWGDPEDEK